MPRRNGTGPAGSGPRTGRAAGGCAPTMNTAGGRGRGGRGRHGGRGRCNRSRAAGLAGLQQAATEEAALGTPEPVDPAAAKQEELEELKEQAEHLQDSLGGINKRIEELEAKASEEAKE